MKVGLPASFLCLMERILHEEVVQAMQHVGWGDYTNPQPGHAAVTKSSKTSSQPVGLRSKSRQIPMQGVEYSDGKKIIGHDLGIEPFSSDLPARKKLSALCREDMIETSERKT